MPQKNILPSIPYKFNIVRVLMHKSGIIIAGCLALALLFLAGSCKKAAAAAGNRSAQEALFEENILNRNFIVHLATDTARDITNEFNGYNFVLTKDASYYGGNMTGTINSVVYSGTWACNEDFSKLTISITNPNTPVEFNFINRSWKFTKKAFPIMELAPWGSTDPKVLQMERL